MIKKVFLCFVSKPRVGPINSYHFNFKRGNIFAGICTLVLSLWSKASVDIFVRLLQLRRKCKYSLTS
jgi:hypothetical protein